MPIITAHRHLGVRRCCAALDVAPATYYRAQRPVVSRAPIVRPLSPRALQLAERAAVLDVLHAPQFADLAPAAVHATLLDDGSYLCSVRTMYRVLATVGGVRERRAQRQHPSYPKPELLATAPNQLWSWDITKLRGPVRGFWYALYVVLDVFSRCVVGWRLAARERGELAEELFRWCREQQRLPVDVGLTIHADRGGPMTGKPVSELPTRPSGSASRQCREARRQLTGDVRASNGRLLPNEPTLATAGRFSEVYGAPGRPAWAAQTNGRRYRIGRRAVAKPIRPTG